MPFRMFFLIFIMFADVTIHAQTKPKKVQRQPTAFAWTRGNVENLRKMFHPNAPVRILAGEEERQRDRESGFVRPGARNALFRKIGIEAKASKMDEFDKDMLVMSAREYNLRELKADYPMFTEKQLRSLKDELRKMK